MGKQKYIKNICLLLFIAVFFLSFNIKEGKGLSLIEETKQDSLAYTSKVTLPDTSKKWKNITSAKDLSRAYPNRLKVLFKALNLDYPGLGEVKSFLQKKDTVAAAQALLEYYRQADSGSWMSPKFELKPADTVLKEAGQMLQDTIDIRRGPVHVPRLSNGGIDWNYTGPNNDDEFGYNLNDHQYLYTLLHAWRKTSSPDFPKKIDQFIRDWTIHNPLPTKEGSIYKVLNTSTETLDWRDIGEVRWRVLEAGNRLSKVWPQMFYALQQADGFTPAARLLMLSGLYEHAEYIGKYHSKQHNHALMELNGLALVGLTFPEFKKSDEWFQHSRNRMLSEMKYLVYPDGTSKELTSSYQIVALKAFERFVNMTGNVDKKVGATFEKYLKKMNHYLAYVMRPDGYRPLNSDTDREDLRPRVLQAAEKYDRPDWQWIATNGEFGEEPEGLPSKTFPWAGIHVMRSGWDQNAHWAFFDTGPFGTAHQHSDKLHLSVTAYGKDLLVDGGRYTYEDYFSFDPTTWRGYFRSSFSHNVILIDGQGQTRESNTVDAPLQEGVDYINTPTFDFARGTYTGGFARMEGNAEHQRAVLYVKNKYWVVVDQISTDRPRQIQALWHYGPDLPVQVEGQQVTSTKDNGANLRIVPVGWDHWSPELIEGQTEPVIQGWYSAVYGKKIPNPTAVYKTKIEGDTTFAWVLIPGEGTVKSVEAKVTELVKQQIKIEVERAGEERVTVTVPLGEKGSPSVK